MTGWQQMDSAPKDGTRILLCLADGDEEAEVIIVSWRDLALTPAEVGWTDDQRLPLRFRWNGCMMLGWQPLPEPVR